MVSLDYLEMGISCGIRLSNYYNGSNGIVTTTSPNTFLMTLHTKEKISHILRVSVAKAMRSALGNKCSCMFSRWMNMMKAVTNDVRDWMYK
jgi:hypothetical protein